MKVLGYFLAVIAVTSAGIIPNGGLGSISLGGLDQTAYSLNGLSSGGVLLSGGSASEVQSLAYPSQGAVVTGLGDSQGLSGAFQIYCPENAQEVGNVQLVQPAALQYVQPVVQNAAEFNTYQIIKQAPPPAPEVKSFQIVRQQPAPAPEIRFVKLVRQEPAPAPEVNYLQLVRQAPAPAPEVRTVQIVREQPAPPPEVRTVQLIRQQPAPPPQVKTLQFITEAGESSAPVESKVQIQSDESGAQTVRFLQEGDGADGTVQKVFRIVQS